MLYVVLGIVFIMVLMFVFAFIDSFGKDKIMGIFDKDLNKIKEFQNKILELESEIRAMPDDEVLNEIKEIQRKSLEEMQNQLKTLIGTYLEKKFNFVYVIVNEDLKVTDNLRKAYKLLAEKRYGLTDIKIIKEHNIRNEIEKKVNRNLFSMTDVKPIKIIDTTGSKFWHPGMKD